MALVKCPECSAEMSNDALACPRCGKPNKKAVNKRMDSKQAAGCLLMLLSLALGGFDSTVGVIIFVVGLVLFLVYTRVW